MIAVVKEERKNRIGRKIDYYGLLPITNRQRAIPPMIIAGSPADCGVVGVTQTTPHPPGQPFPVRGQENVPPVGHGGGVHTKVGVVQTIPHPPGQPFPARGQENVPPAGHTGGVQTTETAGAGDGASRTAETGTFTINRRIRKRTGKNLLSIRAIVRDFIKKIGLPVCGIPGLS
jgi:hypothetical protein